MWTREHVLYGGLVLTAALGEQLWALRRGHGFRFLDSKGKASNIGFETFFFYNLIIKAKTFYVF